MQDRLKITKRIILRYDHRNQDDSQITLAERRIVTAYDPLFQKTLSTKPLNTRVVKMTGPYTG